MWGTFLSEPLPIVALVGRYPANQLMGRIPIAHRNQPFVMTPCGITTASGIKLAFARLSRSVRQVGYALLTRAPVAIIGGQARLHAAPRLACVKPVASVHPEPGSNSSSYLSFLFLFFLHDAAGNPAARFPEIRAAEPQKTAAARDTASLSSSYGIFSKNFSLNRSSRKASAKVRTSYVMTKYNDKFFPRKSTDGIPNKHATH